MLKTLLISYFTIHVDCVGAINIFQIKYVRIKTLTIIFSLKVKRVKGLNKECLLSINTKLSTISVVEVELKEKVYILAYGRLFEGSIYKIFSNSC